MLKPARCERVTDETEIARREHRIEQIEREIARYRAPSISELHLRRACMDAREAVGRTAVLIALYFK